MYAKTSNIQCSQNAYYIMFNLAHQQLSHISVDCIKACPFQQHCFALAYYQTNPTEEGAIAVATIRSGPDLQLIKPQSSPPLLHLTWCAALGRNDMCLLAAASRTNDVLIYQYSLENGELTLMSTLQAGEGIFCLYLDMQALNDHYRILVSSNESTVVDITLDSAFTILDRKSYSKHEYAVWTCRLNPFNSSFVCGDEVNSIYLYNDGKLTGKNNTAHTGGLCDLTFLNQNNLYSGGFDGIVALFDVRKFKECVSRHDYGGTIWRVLPNPKADQVLLCNSSQKKFQIVSSDLKEQIWNSGTAHDSLAYAADWGNKSLVTASFYDKKMCFWDAQS